MNDKTRVFTPKEVEQAMQNLPAKYVGPVWEILKEWKEAGLVDTMYSRNHIVNIRNGKNNAFNEEIMQALVFVGLKRMEVKKQFERITKKAPKSN